MKHLLLLALTTVVMACGNSSGSSSNGGQGNNASSSYEDRSYMGTYTAQANSMPSSDAYNITVRIYSNGTAEGDHAIDPHTGGSADISGSVSNGVLSFHSTACGGDNLTGTLNLSTGALTFSGSVCGNIFANGRATLSRLQ